MKEVEKELKTILDWAHVRLSEGKEPPWSWYQLMKLRESIETILAGAQSVPITAGSQQSDEQPGSDPRQSGRIVRLDTVQHHHDPEQEPPPK